MPAPVDWTIRLVVLAALLTLLVEVRRLRREVRARDARDAEVAGQVQRLMSRRRPNPEEDDENRRRRFWMVIPSVAFLAAVGTWAKHYSGPIAGVVSTAAAVTLFVIAGSGGSTHHEGQVPDPIAPVPTSEMPRSTTAPPPATTTTGAGPVPVTAVTFTPAALAPTGMLTTTTGMPSATTVPTATITTTTSLPPTSTPTSTTPCLLDVKLDPLLRLCVAT